MKTIKVLGIIAITMIIGFTFAACNNLFGSKDTPGSEYPPSSNPALTGTVSITGTAQVGRTLWANISSLGGNGIIMYDWKRSGIIVGGNNSYEVKAADVGHIITLIVTRAGHTGSVSASTAVVIAALPTPVATDFIISNLTQTVGQVIPVTIRPKEGKSTGAINIFYNSPTYNYSTVLPEEVGTYTVIFYVAETDGWAASNELNGGTLTINAENQNPAADDFEIGNLTQTAGNITPVTITPNTGASTGNITIYYDGSTELPTEAGTYAITFDVAAALGWNAAYGLSGGTLRISAQGNAQAPVITRQPDGSTAIFNASHSLYVEANSPDGGTLSYQWYSNTSATNSGGTSLGNGARSASYSPPINAAGTFYYFVEVTNTITDNGDGGKKTASVRSNAAAITSGEMVINLAGTDEWELTAQTVHVFANVNKTFAVTGTYTAYRWYLDGTQVGTSSTYTFNKPFGVYQLVVVVTDNNGESRSGHCWITVDSQPSALTANVWANSGINAANDEDWYSFPVSSGITYRVWWNDRKQGNGKTGDVAVSARYENGATFIFGGTNTTVDSGWTTPQSFTATQTGTVEIRVILFNRDSSNAGSYGLVYSTTSTMPIYTVTFDLNGGTGSAPAQSVTPGSSITLPGGSGLSRNYYTFGGWSTDSSGTGTNYTGGSSYTPTGTITLYARWYPNFTVTFDRNNGTGTTPAFHSVSPGSSTILPSGSGLSRNGFTFGGWNTNASGSGTNYNAGATYTPTGNITLYARWHTNYTVTFDINTGTGITPAAQTGSAASGITLPDRGFSKASYTFGGWNTNASGTGTNYDGGSVYIPTANITLYARWYSVVTFNINNGIGTTPAVQSVNMNFATTLPGGSGFSRDNYVLGGWNTYASGTGTNYNAGSSYTPSGNITLYASWHSAVALTANVWALGSITQANHEIWYSFPVTAGTNYGVWWNDRKEGSNRSVDVVVGARYAGSDTWIFGGTDTSVDNGWNTPQRFVADQTGTVEIRVKPYMYSSYDTGIFSIVYSTSFIRPAQ